MSNTILMMMAAGGGAEQPIDGQTGVWIKSDGVTISSAMKMTGATITSGQTQYVYSRGVAQSCVFTQSSTQSVYIGGVASGCVYAAAYPIYGRIYGGTLVGGSVGAGAIVSATSGAIVRDMDVTVSLSILSGFGSNIRGSNGCTVVAGDYSGNTSGVIDGLTISNGRLIVAYTGQVRNAVVVGSAQIFQRGLATYVDATINGGSMLLSSNYLSGYYRDPAIGGFVNMSWYVGTMTSCGFGSGQVLQHGTATYIDIYSKCDYQVRGILSGAMVESGGSLTVSSGASVSACTVSGRVSAYAGALVEGMTLDNGSAWVVSGGSGSGVTVGGSNNIAGRLYVEFAGARVDDVTIGFGGYVVARHGGAVVSGVTISNGGQLYPLYSGSALDVTIASGGNASAGIDGGYMSNVTVENGGRLTVSSGGTALAVTSNAGATVVVVDGGYIEYVTS